MSDEFFKSIVELDEEKAISLANSMLEQKEDPVILLNISIEAMKKVGDRFAAGEYFLPELLMAGEIMEAINKILLPLMSKPETEEKGETVILGTVKSDVHDIGKNIVRFILETNGYHVEDLGVDVAPESFVAAAERFGTNVIGLSALLTVSYEAMRDTVEAFEKAGLRDSVRVMIGGGSVDDQVLEYTKADARGESAIDAVKLAQGWLKEKDDDHGRGNE